MTTPDTLAKLAAEYRPTMTLDVLHSWAAEAARALTAQALPAAEPTDAQIDAAIDAYDTAWVRVDMGRPNKETAMRAALKAAQQAAQATAGWVSVEDRLPAIGESVLFIVKSGDSFYHGRLLGGRFEVLAGMPGFSTPGITYGASHWMPAPPTPAALPQPQPQSAQAKGDA